MGTDFAIFVIGDPKTKSVPESDRDDPRLIAKWSNAPGLRMLLAMRLGIDFGTTRTVVAAAVDGRYPVASFELADGYRAWLPGVVAWDGAAWCFGEAAEDALRAGSPGLRSIKRAVSGLAADDPVPMPGAPPIGALALAARFLAWVKESILTRSNLDAREPLEAMVAVPANASSRQRFLTIEAFRMAGFSVVGVINEPTAAAIEHAHRNRAVLSARSPKKYVVVYDLGGGTFDTAAVSLEGHRFELIASEGASRLGGDDVDQVVLDLALEAWGGPSIDPRWRPGLLEICRAAKETLGPRSQRLLIDPSPLLALAPAVLDVKELCDRAQPLVDRTLAHLAHVFASLPRHDIDPDDARQLAAVYLVGGAVAFPLIGRALRARYGRKIQLAPEPHAATAIGLAVAADEAAPVLVREASTRYLGVWREAEGGREAVFDALLQKDVLPEAGAPIVVSRRYRPAHTVGHLRFLECTELDAEGRPGGDLTPFRELLFPYDARWQDVDDLRAAPIERTAGLGDVIVETYTYETDGRVRVTIENATRHYRRELELT